jgi:hypothetical protein
MSTEFILTEMIIKNKLRGLSPLANYTGRAIAASAKLELLQIEGC